MARMTYEQRRQGLIAKIHVAQTQLALDEDSYRAILQRITGQKSCKNCDLAQLQRVMDEMQRLGFKPTKKSIGRKPLHFTDVSDLMAKLGVLLRQTEKSWAYADGMARQMFKKDKVNQLDARQLHKLIAALNYHHLKKQANAAKTA
ncbi:MAG: regulatory protein GemA [Alysiella sp.]|uniref:gp16 family protein n=1 Tax=Alysiella sp. TaxID=1872483 RepID=UPI0026DB09AD|nr:regulatory protein GemA [Alysiella sp.]MDO4434724.1 regulatory protein GemA [Alysiella sp.]